MHGIAATFAEPRNASKMLAKGVSRVMSVRFAVAVIQASIDVAWLQWRSLKLQVVFSFRHVPV